MALRPFPEHETALAHAVRAVPTTEPGSTVGEVRRALEGRRFETAGAVYVLDGSGRLVGRVRMTDLLAADAASPIADSTSPEPLAVGLDADQESVAHRAIERDVPSVPVVDADGRLRGVVPPESLLAIPRRERVEDIHRLAGIRRENVHAVRALEAPPTRRTRDRLPWLLVGLAGAVATTVGLRMPWLLSKAGRDPAFGSGLLATIVQDVPSNLVHFVVATLLALGRGMVAAARPPGWTSAGALSDPRRGSSVVGAAGAGVRPRCQGGPIMRSRSIVALCAASALAGAVLASVRPASAKDAEAVKVGEAVLAFAKGTMPGGEFGLELAADGTLGRLESQVALADVPQACMAAAEKHAGGGAATRADRQWVGGETFWQVTRDVGGLRHETLMKGDGTVVGSEVVVKPEACAKGILEASEKAAPGSELVAVERITGPEALGGQEWHVKRKLNGEVLRISVLDDGSVGRVVRKVPGETKIPR